MSLPELSVLIINFRTPDLTRLCLRSLNRHTAPGRIKVIVVDNDSGDESLNYLRGLDWIELIERPSVPGERPADAHANALDLALSHADTPYVLSIHTDTVITDSGWLDYLLARIEPDAAIAGVGSWKLEIQPWWKRAGKAAEDFFKRLSGRGKNEKRYLRSHCALYRTDLVRRYGHGFNDGGTAGCSLHYALVDAGYRMIFLPPGELGRYLRHFNHATMILNAAISGRKTGRESSRRRLQAELDAIGCREILADAELDQRRAL